MDKPLSSSHDRILVDLRSGREDLPADLGQAHGGHHTTQQPVQQQQVQHSRSQGQTLIRTPHRHPRVVAAVNILVYFRL